MPNLMRSVINAIKPKGSAWRIAYGGDWDKFFDGLADCYETVREFLAGLADIRDPHKTAFLDELENEYGIFTNPILTETQRRNQLSSVVYNRDSNGSKDDLQRALDDAGFNVLVHENSPAVDPDIFLTQAFQMVADGGNAYAGRSDAFASVTGGELLVNGEIFETTRVYTQVAGNVYAGDGTTAGEYDELLRSKIEYPIPTNPNDWPLVFFVGGPATRNVSGELTDIDLASVPAEQEIAFKRIILKYKPMHSWAALIVNFG